MKMKLGHFSLSPKKQECSECHEKFHEYSELVNHVKRRHHGPVLRCHNCGQDFVKASNRYHHLQEEKARRQDSADINSHFPAVHLSNEGMKMWDYGIDLLL